MSSTIELLAGERGENESDKAVLACCDYLRMGPGRSLRKLHQTYTETTPEEPPTQSYRWLKEWSRLYDWQRRVGLYDAQFEQRKNEERRAVMEAGLALDYERVRELTEIYQELKDDFTDNGLWYEDVKLSARGDQVKVEVFNKSLIDSMRGVLDDIAKETGGRKQQVNHLLNQIDYSRLTDEQLERIADGEEPLKVILSAYSSASES